MNEFAFWGPLASGAIGLLCLWASLRLRRRHRLFSDLPTSKVRGVFIGLVETKGSAETETPFTSYLAGASCVHYSWQIAERWSRTVTESYTDSKGRRRTRRRTESGWKTVAHGGESGPFFLKDDSGALLVRPDGAKIEAQEFFSQTVTRDHPLYYGKGPPDAVSHSDHVRRFVESGIRLHAPLYIVGQARERADIVAPEIAAHSEAAEFIISTRTEEHVCSRLAGWSWFWWALGLLITSAPFLFVVFNFRSSDLPSSGFTLIAPIAYLLTWVACWVWMVYNSLVGLRERVRQGWSLIEVQLKRRHDLIPNLAVALSALSSHEKEVQETLAALRAQTTATRPGESGPDFDGLAGHVRMVAEKYPQLTAQPAFAALQRQLVETEQRIALARAYYNNIATQFATRLEIVPDRWVGGLGGMRPEPLLQATGFERAVVRVQLSD
jgi:hypothetical protein